MTAPKTNFKTMKEFWPFYLSEHSKPKTQKIHAIGTYLGVAAAGVAVATGVGWLALAGLATTYACAWVSHFFIQKNKPATFQYPVKSFVSDLRMASLWTVGRLKKEFDKHGLKMDVTPKKAKPAPAPKAEAPAA